MIKVGRLQVDLVGREIFRGGVIVPIASRAFDILALLVSKNGVLVSKEEILDKIWPNRVVEENNLQVHISALRKLLEPDRQLLKTVFGRGYYLLPVARDADSDVKVGGVVGKISSNLPLIWSALIGRDDAVIDVSLAMNKTRLLTLVGAGGIGKTRLAIAAAHEQATRFAGNVIFVSLDPASDRHSVLDAVAVALGVRRAHAKITLSQISTRLANRHLLLIFDNCEQVLESVAGLVEALLGSNAGLNVLATSREALHLSGEVLYNVAPLCSPGVHDREEDVVACSAVQLFLSRARAIDGDFASNPRCVDLAASVCRQLDGVPLAIELAAARAAVLGIRDFTEHLVDRFRVLSGGHRTAVSGGVKAHIDGGGR